MQCARQRWSHHSLPRACGWWCGETPLAGWPASQLVASGCRAPGKGIVDDGGAGARASLPRRGGIACGANGTTRGDFVHGCITPARCAYWRCWPHAPTRAPRPSPQVAVRCQAARWWCRRRLHGASISPGTGGWRDLPMATARHGGRGLAQPCAPPGKLFIRRPRVGVQVVPPPSSQPLGQPGRIVSQPLAGYVRGPRCPHLVHRCMQYAQLVAWWGCARVDARPRRACVTTPPTHPPTPPPPSGQGAVVHPSATLVRRCHCRTRGQVASLVQTVGGRSVRAGGWRFSVEQPVRLGH